MKRAWMLGLAMLPALVACQNAPHPSDSALPSVRVLVSPFTGAFRVSNVSDHEYPFQFKDNNGFLLSWWGEELPGVDGHQGYDFPMPEGTPVRAVYDGEVTFAGQEQPFFCPPLGQTVSGLGVVIRHRLPDGEAYLSIYAHFSEVRVREGEQVTAGQEIGLSGNTGCSTGPHLHFEMRKNKSGTWAVFDPYGWEGEGPDPWSRHPAGVASAFIWRDGEAPPLFSEVELPPNPRETDRAPLAITRVRYMGVRDSANPNNEFVEITADPRYASAPLSLGGFSLRNKVGESFSFPSLYLNPGETLRVYSGSGTGGERVLYWGRSAPAWDNWGDCVQLVYPSGGRYLVGYRSGCYQTQMQALSAIEESQGDKHNLPLP